MIFGVAKRFIFVLFSALILYVVLINLIQFSGLSSFFGYSANNFNNSYFGFTSIYNAWLEFPLPSDYVPNLLSDLNELKDKLVIPWTNFINTFNGIYNWWDVVFALCNFLIELLAFPIYAVMIIGKFLFVDTIPLIANCVSWFFSLLSGAFNTRLIS